MIKMKLKEMVTALITLAVLKSLANLIKSFCTNVTTWAAINNGSLSMVISNQMAIIV
jgi:hypothetical protein